MSISPVFMLIGTSCFGYIVISGTHAYATIEAEAKTELERHGWRPDYVTVRRRNDLHMPHDDDRELVILGAARLGTPRLLDNLEITL